MKSCDGLYHYIAGEETEAPRHDEFFLRSHTNQYRARGKSWFWHSALSTELIISLCPSVVRWFTSIINGSWPSAIARPCHGLAMQSELLVIHLSLMGGLKHKCQLGEGCGMQSLSQTPHPCRRPLHRELASPSCCGSRQCPAAPAGAASCPAQAWLKLVVHTVYIPSAGWPGQVVRKGAGKVGLAQDVMYLHFLRQGQMRFHYIPQHARSWIITPASLFSSRGQLCSLYPCHSWREESLHTSQWQNTINPWDHFLFQVKFQLLLNSFRPHRFGFHFPFEKRSKFSSQFSVPLSPNFDD